MTCVDWLERFVDDWPWRARSRSFGLEKRSITRLSIRHKRLVTELLNIEQASIFGWPSPGLLRSHSGQLPETDAFSHFKG